jgi:hypothetical protein
MTNDKCGTVVYTAVRLHPESIIVCGVDDSLFFETRVRAFKQTDHVGSNTLLFLQPHRDRSCSFQTDSEILWYC